MLNLLDLLANVRIRDHGKGCLKLRKRLGLLAGIGQQLCFAAQACELLDFPNGLAPKTGPKPKGTGKGPLPKADVLLVTWTVDEGHALSRVLTPGKDSRNDYVPYTHNFAKIAKKMRKGCPALQAKRLGAFWTTTIGKKSVVVFKSDSHMSQDGPQLPNIDVWRQLIREVKPKLVITTGTAGGIGKQFEVGDVVVSPIVRFDCTAKFKKEPFAQAHFSSVAAKSTKFAQAKKLFTWGDAQRFLRERGVTLISAGLDEVPMAYKDIDEVMAAQSDLVEPLARFEPRLVKMAPGSEPPED